MATKKKTYKPINPKAKKYQGLAKKQAEANRYLKQARITLGKDHKAYKNTMNKIHMFQKRHGLDRKNSLSMSGLTTKDVELYTELVDSIRDSTYINPKNYELYIEQQEAFFRKEGWGKTSKEIKAFMDFRDSDVFEEIAGETVTPSSLLNRAKEYNEGQFNLEEFGQIIQLFMRENAGKEADKRDFFNFADKFEKAKKEKKEDLDDFDKAVDYYLSDDILNDYEILPTFDDFIRGF